ncbi:hypothetical protein, partial [Pseudomonas corrugata]|uniref:hypothetical protein n=2 Tax=Pseudomonas corrugata TaxID=47879 RepID=UPI001F5271E4
KEFSVSTAPEVGRIIETQNLPSTLNYAFLSIRDIWQMKSVSYIDAAARNAHYIAQISCLPALTLDKPS